MSGTLPDPARAERTPRQIVTELDKYIIGQEKAKRAVAIALRNRWRRLQVEPGLREEIMPNNIILIGPTGVGKTEIARRVARLTDAPFIKVEASKFTEVGYVGRDVESIIRDLTEYAVTMVKAEMRAAVNDRAKEMAEERLLDLLLPAGPGRTEGADDGGTREKLRAKLRAGEMDGRTVEMDLASEGNPFMQVIGPAGMDDLGANLQEMLGGILPRRTKRRKTTVGEARVLLANEEASKLIDHDAAIRAAVHRVENAGIVFLDEIDKIAGSRTHAGGPDVSREGVQRDLLPVVEGSSVTTKYGQVRTDHILFVASGAFHVAKPSDLIPELQGRFPIRVEMDTLTREDFVLILTRPENALIKQYAALLATEGVTVDFRQDGIEEIAAIAAEANEQVENIGARRLHTVMTTLLEDVLFETPGEQGPRMVTVDRALVQDRLASIVRNRDLSRYIL